MFEGVLLDRVERLGVEKLPGDQRVERVSASVNSEPITAAVWSNVFSDSAKRSTRADSTV